MGRDGLLNHDALVEEAKASKHGEAYKTLDRGLSYRIGIGVRLRSSEDYFFFIEILIYLCPASGDLNLETMEKLLACLKEFEKRGYYLTCQDGECISCETTVSTERLAEEYVAAKSLIEDVMNLQ